LQCVFNPNANVAFKPADIKAAIGMRRLTDKPDVDFDLATVTNIIVHRKLHAGSASAMPKTAGRALLMQTSLRAL